MVVEEGDAEEEGKVEGVEGLAAQVHVVAENSLPCCDLSPSQVKAGGEDEGVRGHGDRLSSVSLRVRVDLRCSQGREIVNHTCRLFTRSQNP